MPLRAFALRQIDERSVALRAEPRVMLARPCIQGRQIVLVDELGQRAAPVVAQVGGLRRGPGREFRQMRRQVVAAARAKLVEEVWRPVGLVYFQAVAEDRVGNVFPASLNEWIGEMKKRTTCGPETPAGKVSL